MKRGEIWTLAGGGDFAGKPRPVVILQDDRFELDSVTVCPMTTSTVDAPLFRVEIQPTSTNGLQMPSRVMADKITSVRRTRIGMRTGHLTQREMTALGRCVLSFLGFADASRTRTRSPVPE